MIRISKLDETTYRLESEGIITTAREGRFGLRVLLRRVERKWRIWMSVEEIKIIEEILDREGIYELIKEEYV